MNGWRARWMGGGMEGGRDDGWKDFLKNRRMGK